MTLTNEEREIADRDEIQKAMGNLGKRLRPSTDNQDDQARFGVPAYVGNEERDDERSAISQAGSFAGSVASDYFS
jgi:hypothetical protein